MTERQIDPSNYLDLADGREDIAVTLMQQDQEHLARLSTPEERLARGIYDEAVDPYVTEEMKQRAQAIESSLENSPQVLGSYELISQEILPALGHLTVEQLLVVKSFATNLASIQSGKNNG